MTGSSVSFIQRDWERIQKLGLYASVASPDVYAARVAHGVRLAQATLAATKEVVPSIQTIRGLHYLTFESVHPWAGTFRRPGQEVRAGNLICSLAENVVGDLMKLRKEMLDNPLSGPVQYKAEVVAFYHATFLAIHPFADGNGRVGRVILDVHTRKLLGYPLSRSIGREEYIEALSLAQQEGRLRPLAKLFSRNHLHRSRAVGFDFERGPGEISVDRLLVSKPRIEEESPVRGRARR